MFQRMGKKSHLKKGNREKSSCFSEFDVFLIEIGFLLSYHLTQSLHNVMYRVTISVQIDLAVAWLWKYNCKVENVEHLYVQPFDS